MMPPMDDGCYARLDGEEWIVGNRHIERRWNLRGGTLRAASLLDKATGRQWLRGESATASPVGESATESMSPPQVQIDRDARSPVQLPSLVATLTFPSPAGATQMRFRVFADARSITTQLITPAHTPATSAAAEPASFIPTGGEASDNAKKTASAETDLLEHLALQPAHYRLIGVELRDQTDVHGNLAFETTYFLDPAERQIRLGGNLFILEDVLTGDGLIFFKHAPLPHARPVKNPHDLDVRSNFDLAFLGHGTANGGEGYPFATICYRGGKVGRTAALHDYQRLFRPYVAGRDGLLQSNTWGDRSQDGRVSETFMRGEITAAERLGVDVVQIDDGWQSGKTIGSVEGGGVWQGYWSVSGDFWKPHPQRFPNGLGPLAQQTAAAGLQFGLWFSPDSADDFAHWEDDARTLLTLHRELGVTHFKIDGVKAITKKGERNLYRFFDTLLRESAGKITFDLDVTAEIRPGYLALPQIGPLFVENRYTDWKRYYPHHTLRTLWTLSHYIDPPRLRMEFLNNTRNAEKYGDDPLAPARYQPDCLFATTMFASPLGWFEVSNLPENYITQVAPLVRQWKRYREEIHTGQIVPIGQMPDGASWTGFCSIGDRSVHVLAFRELSNAASHLFDVPGLPPNARPTLLAGEGSAAATAAGLQIGGLEPLRFAWFRFER